MGPIRMDALLIWIDAEGRVCEPEGPLFSAESLAMPERTTARTC